MTSYLTSIWRYRHFWLSLVRMDLRTRYRRSVLGLGWSLLQPLAMAAILCLVFHSFMKQQVREYVPHLLTGLVCWNFIVACAVHGCQCFFNGEAYIRQCPLPLAIYPLRTAIGAMFHFGMGSIVLIAICTAMQGAFPGPIAILSLIPTIAILFVFGWSLAVLGGSANVYFQDTQHLAEVCFQILFYLTPIIWNVGMLGSHSLGWLLAWNPVIAFMTLIREPMLHGVAPSMSHYAYALAVTTMTTAMAAWVLSRLQKKLIFQL
jgi:ABC-type polysaccharide/polyol phosphate export permease